MLRPRPFTTAALACAGAIALVSPAQPAHAGSLRMLTDTLSATVKKQLDPKTGVISTDLQTTLRNVGGLLTPRTDPTCAAQETSKPFSQWRDLANYVPVPNSGFEQGLEGWQPQGRVAVVADNNPYFISGRGDDTKSVTLTPGSSIASASFCGGLEYPTIRMMTRSADGRPAKAMVTVRYTGRDGLVAQLPLGSVTAAADWNPSEITLTASGLPLLTGTRLAVTITGVSGTIAVDDVYVDPFRRA